VIWNERNNRKSKNIFKAEEIDKLLRTIQWDRFFNFDTNAFPLLDLIQGEISRRKSGRVDEEERDMARGGRNINEICIRTNEYVNGHKINKYE
jgi:hypothetical protein